MTRWYKDIPWMVTRPIHDTFEYYRDILSYQSRYPKYYGKIEAEEMSNGIIVTKEFLNLNLDAYRDHLSIKVEYHVIEPYAISFEIKDIKSRVGTPRGALRLTPQEFYLNGKRSEGTLISGMISALEIMSLPPGSKNSAEYDRMLIYFGEKDAEILEAHVYGYRPGQQCIKCGKGQLQKSGKKLYSEIKLKAPLNEQQTTIEVLLCNYCGNSFESNFVRLK